MGVPVLHCYADWKWTGPSEPVTQLCHELSKRGWNSDLACMRTPPGRESELALRARGAGVSVFEHFFFSGRPNIFKNLRDIRQLRRLFAAGRYRIVHCHGTWDHALASMARCRLGLPLVRTDHGARDMKDGMLWKLYYGPRMTDHLIVLSDRHATQADSRAGLAPSTVTTVRGWVDTDKFLPIAPPVEIREGFGLAEGDFVIGIVARVQRHRRWHVLLDAAEIVRSRNRGVRIVVLGRGTNKEELLDEPIRRRGLGDIMRPLGYRRGDYAEALSIFDAGMMLVPGSDGSCRAAMQMAAMCKPLVVAMRGVLPDIVRDGETGIVVNDTPENLAEAILEMAADRERAGRWGEAGRERMKEHFRLSRQVEKVIEVYESLLE